MMFKVTKHKGLKIKIKYDRMSKRATFDNIVYYAFAFYFTTNQCFFLVYLLIYNTLISTLFQL